YRLPETFSPAPLLFKSKGEPTAGSPFSLMNSSAMTLPQARRKLPDRLETALLVLRAPERGDIDAIAALANDRAIFEMTAALPHPYRREHAEGFVDHMARTADEWAYAIALRNGPLLGVAGVHIDRDPWEIGYWIGQPFWGRGYASEAA